MASTTSVMTAKDLERVGERCELVRGELITMTPSGFQHGRVVARITRLLDTFVDEHGLGTVFGAETGFLLETDPDTVRAPDVAFVAAGRQVSREGTTFAACAPDLVVEVLSPTDRWREVMAKTDFWLAHGVKAVWLVDPERRQVDVVTIAGRERLSDNQIIAGGPVLPGLSFPIAEFFS